MRVLMIESGGWGGICHYSYNLCTALADREIQVTLLTAQPYELAHLPHNFDVQTPFTATTPYLQKLRTVVRSYRTMGPHAVHVQSTFSARKDWPVFLLSSILGIPTIVTTHNILPHEASEREAQGMRTAYRFIYRFSRQTIVHSRDSKRSLHTLFAPPENQISIIPHGNYIFTNTAGQISQTGARQRLGLPVNGRLLLAFGTIRPYKGTEDLLNAFAQIAQEQPDVHLVIAGKPIGVDAEQHQRLIEDLGIASRVSYRPEYVPMEEMGLYFQAADIAIYPYHAIYQSGALQLAYAFSRPVIATDVGAFPETVEAGKNGLIIPPHSSEKLAHACLELLRLPPQELTRMGIQSRHLADTRYAWHSIAEKTESVYRKQCTLRSFT